MQTQYFSPSFIISKIKEKGVAGFFQTALKITSGKIAWIFPSLRFILKKNEILEKRILAIWDFQTVPYSIGELLVLQETTLILKWLHKADKIDIVFVCDPDKPARHDQGLTPYNYYYHLNDLIPVVSTNPYLGSFFLLDSYIHLEKFVTGNIDHYHVWPPGKAYLSRNWEYRKNFDFIQKFYKKQKFIPYLTCRPVILDWAGLFIKKHILPDIAVSVHLRNNPLMKDSLDRNAKIEEWMSLFEYCQDRFPVKFIVICAHDEIDDRLKRYSNVVISKDFHTTIEQDLALIQTSAMFMGGPSGPATIAWFSDLPYIIFNYGPINETLKEGSQFDFANSMQKLIWKPETSPVLIQEFMDMFNKIDTAAWHNRYSGSFNVQASHFCLR